MLRDGFGDKPFFHVLVAEWTADDGPTVDTTVDTTKPSTSMPHNERTVGHALFFYTYSAREGRCLYLDDLCVREECRSEYISMLPGNRFVIELCFSQTVVLEQL